MIVTEENVQAALEYLAIDPHPMACAEYNLTVAKNKREELFAKLYTHTEGTVRERECQVELSPDYKAAKEWEAQAIMNLASEKAKRTWADKITDLYQTVSANQRYAERIR